MSLFTGVLFLIMACTLAQAQFTTEASQSTPGYRFRYFVRDDRTGDIKGQTEVRQGDDVRGSYALAEPNGGMRVVTYTAGKDTGFKARVQVHQGNAHLPPLPPQSEPSLSSLMRIPPRNIYRTGFPQLEIKVLPPSATAVPHMTQNPPFSPEEEQLLRGQDPPNPGYSEQNYERFTSPDETIDIQNVSTTVHHEQQSTTPEQNLSLVSSTTPKVNCQTSCEEQGRGRIKQDGDQVQLEMEQVIRTEMKDPESVNMGKPYQQVKPTQYPPNNGRPLLHFTPFKPDLMTPVYMKPLYLRTPMGPNAPQWPPIVTSGNRLYIPHIVVENEDVPPEIFPSKVYLVPLPRPITLSQEDLMSLAFPWEGKTPIPKEELSGPYNPNRPKPNPSMTFPPTFTYLIVPKDTRQK